MQLYARTYRVILLIGLALLPIIQSSYSQIPLTIANQQDEKLRSVLEQAILYSKTGRSYDAIILADEALQIAIRQNQENIELRALELLGDIYYSSEQVSDGIPYYLRASSIYELRTDSVQMIRLYEKIAEGFQIEKVYSKELEYYQKILPILSEKARDKKLEIKTRVGTAAFHSGKYETAILNFRDLLSAYRAESVTWLSITQDMISSFDAAGSYDSALHYCEILLGAYQKLNDSIQIIRLNNNIAHYHSLSGDFPSALAYYLSAIKIAEISEIDPVDYAIMKTNAAVCFSNLRNEKDAIKQFNEALVILESENASAEMTRNENLLAKLYYSSGDLYNSGLFCRRAMQSAVKAGNPWMEAQAYRTYSNVLRDGNDPVNALKYYEKYLDIRDSISFSQRLTIQTLENKRIMLERQEKALQLKMKEEEVSELAIRQLVLQNDRIEKEKEIMIAERNLDMLKQDSLRQSVIIMDQKLIVAQQEREKTILEQEKRLSEMKLQEEQQAKNAAEKEQELSEQKLKLSQLETEKQRGKKRALIGGVIGAGILLIWILLSLISTRRKKKLLSRQKHELEQKNEEIRAQRDEIEAQRNMVFTQKREIEAVNDEIVKSIEYAKRLQDAALPMTQTLKELVNDQFVLFRPRDVVSGDFYWFAEVEEKMVIAVADCTGHGVPGAFMSMMGISLLKELVQKEYITHPGVILRRMRKEIINTMGQTGASGEAHDGMDIALISYDPKERKVDFAGAYNSLYLVRNKKLPAPVIEDFSLEPNIVNGEKVLYEIPADKMPIAYFDRMDKFRNHELHVMEGDCMYLFTDGFADQFGGPRGKKFMYKPFKELLLYNSHLTMKNQYDILSNTLQEWMGNITQIDDICVMGLKF